MRHSISADDREFLRQFAACEVEPIRFHHPDHIRVAYILLVLFDLDAAAAKLREMLFAFIRHNGVNPVKYHETMTQAWLRAVLHFMQDSMPQSDAMSFIEANRLLLNQQIMMTHYSRELLFSDHARRQFVEPDLQPIPIRFAAA